VLCIQIQGNLHRFDPRRGWFDPVQEVQKMPADGFIVCFHLNSPTVMTEMVPIQQSRRIRSEQFVGYISGTRDVVAFSLRQYCPEYRSISAQYIHGMSRCWKLLQYRFSRLWQPPQPNQ